MTARAGALFPQPSIDGRRADDRLGRGAWLIARTVPEIVPADIETVRATDYPPFAAWLDAIGVDAVLVRPDRHVFGTGDPADLLAAWSAGLHASM